MNDVAGWITIGTRLDNKNLKKQLADQKRELQQNAKEEERLNNQKAKIELDLSSYYEEKKLIEDETDSLLQKEQSQNMVEEHLKVEARLLNELETKYASQFEKIKEINEKLANNKIENQNITKAIEKTNSELEKQDSLDNINKSINNINKGLNKTIKNVGRWVTAIFGIRSIYLGIRSAMGVISQYDEEMSADIEYIKGVLAYTIKPVVEWIINAIKNILQLLGYIVYKFSGKNIFADASKNLKDAQKNAKELKKEVLKFDDLNILGADSSKTGSNFDKTSFNFEDFDFEKTDKEVTKFFDDIVGKWWSTKDEIYSTIEDDSIWENTFGDYGTFFKGLSLTGVSTMEVIDGALQTTGGLMDILVGIFTGDSKLINEGVDNMLGGLKRMLGGLNNFIAGIFFTLIGIVIGALADISKLIGDGWENSKGIMTKAQDWIYEHMDEIGDKFGIVGQVIASILADVIQIGIDLFGGLFDGVKKIVDGIIKLFKGDLWGGIKSIFSGIWDFIKGIINALIDAVNLLINGLNKIQFDIPDYVPGVGGVHLGFNIPNIPKLATGGIVDVPRTGVTLGNKAIVGEQGKEGVLPLTNQQTMQELGMEIAKWITINLAITNEIDGRILNKKLEQIKNNTEFSRNGAKL